ncbi:hypothetical protein V8943_18445, partial [Acinetobacter baumannii]
ARQLLLNAAEKLTPGGGWTLVAGGKVSNGKKTYLFSELVATAATLPKPPQPALTNTTNVIGKPLRRTDLAAKVDGSAVFGIDVQ